MGVDIAADTRQVFVKAAHALDRGGGAGGLGHGGSLLDGV